jgi:hypothetical protein
MLSKNVYKDICIWTCIWNIFLQKMKYFSKWATLKVEEHFTMRNSEFLMLYIGFSEGIGFLHIGRSCFYNLHFPLYIKLYTRSGHSLLYVCLNTHFLTWWRHIVFLCSLFKKVCLLVSYILQVFYIFKTAAYPRQRVTMYWQILKLNILLHK